MHAHAGGLPGNYNPRFLANPDNWPGRVACGGRGKTITANLAGGDLCLKVIEFMAHLIGVTLNFIERKSRVDSFRYF